MEIEYLSAGVMFSELYSEIKHVSSISIAVSAMANRAS